MNNGNYELRMTNYESKTKQKNNCLCRSPLIHNSSFVIRNCLLALFLSAQCFVSDAHAATPNDDIQYLAVHKTHSATTNDNRWNVDDPNSFNQAGMNEILDTIGTRGRTGRRLAVSYTFSYLNYPISKILESLNNMLKLAEDNNVPVVIKLDGMNWWTNRPDLWNWWDPGKPGYNPANIDNVERIDWVKSSTTAVKIGWRNWGAQVRVDPQPNLGSNAFRTEQRKALDEILPAIVKWYNKLPKDKKYLLGGVVLGWEVSPYIGAYYLENGNNYLGTPLGTEPNAAWLPDGSGNVMALGYAAAHDLNLQPGGGPITTATLDAICSDYSRFLVDIALEHGVEPKKIITHTIAASQSFIINCTKGIGAGHAGAGSIIPGEKYKDVIFGWSIGGLSRNSTWSFERRLGARLDTIEGRPWAAIETDCAPNSLIGVDTDRINETFAYKNNRYLNMVNWEQFKNMPAIIAAVKGALTGGGSVSVGAQNGGLLAGTAGSARFPVTTAEIIDGAIIALNNINAVAGITLGTTVTAGDKTTLTVMTTEATPQGAHPMTLTIDGVTSNSFSLIVVNKVSLDDVKYYPNPLQPSKGPHYSKMQFSNIPPGTSIKIYTMLGQVVRELKADASGTAVWDGKNNSGENAASGVYVAYMEDGAGNKKRIKIAVER